MKIVIISVGKLSSDIASLCSKYQKMISSRLEYIELPHSKKSNIKEIIVEETEFIRKKIKKNSLVILLDRLGQQYSSEEFANIIKESLENNQDIDFIIGGSHGVDNSIIGTMVDYKLCISMMTFPHQIVKLLLLEQIYRAQTIIQNHPYHK
ncbi:MAG: 23S rRNA (pseudouridine(1915)-N(3))-methyltransferase RlmH [Rickettsiaceae bacterium]|nr:23S rRNA (pseudouridine(1915)-N(3))-methyltransferase RlmH [Rickettsiaceae bacterium]